MPASSVECKFGTLLLKRTTPSSEKEPNHPPLRIAYRIIRPSLLRLHHDDEATKTNASTAPRASSVPLLIIHGGPSLPSEYLTPISSPTSSPSLQHRCLIFYDQLGCGWSSIPQQNDLYGVSQMATDLLELVCHLKNEWNVDKFHLLGHSLGGAICFEFLKLLKFPPKEIIMGGKKSGDENVNDTSMPECLSFILSNASTNFQLSDSERDRLFEEVKLQQLQTLHPRQMQTAHNNNSIISLPQQQKKDSTPKQQKQQNHHALDVNMQQQFFQMHICRTLTMPSVLQSAFRRRGKDWSAKDYIALPPQMTFKSTASAIHDTCTNNGKSTMSEMKCAGFPPVLIIRGEYDFITETCTRGWRDIFIDEEKDERQHPSSEEDTMASATLSSTKVEYSSNTLKEIVMKDCAHYPHLERPKEFAYEVEDFCSNAEKMMSMQHI